MGNQIAGGFGTGAPTTVGIWNDKENKFVKQEGINRHPVEKRDPEKIGEIA